MASFPRSVIPFEVSALDMPGPLIAKAQSGRVNIRSTQQIGRTWTEHYLINVRTVAGRAMLAAVDNFYRNGTIFTIDHRDHLTPMGAGGGSPLIQAAPQLVADPENFGAWTPTGTPVLTAGQSDPLGGTAAYLINDDSGAVIEYISEVVGFTGNAEKCCALWMMQGSQTVSWARLFDNTAAVSRHTVHVTWTAGVPAVTTIAGSGTRYSPEQHPTVPSWWRIPFTATGVLAANSNSLSFGPGTSTTTADTGTGYYFGANAWNEVSPARYAGPSQVAGTTGAYLYANGGTASLANWLRAGDILSLGGVTPVYEITADISTQANGYAVLPINPPIFSGGGPADNAVVTITAVTLQAVILEPPSFPSTSGVGADWGELVCKFSESL